MDFLRTMYRRRARITAGGSLVTLRWFPVRPAAKLFPHPHAFGSLLWRSLDNQPGCVSGQDPAPPADPPGIGEAEWAFTTIRPQNPGYLGQCFVGEAEWYRSGVPAQILAEPPDPLPDCCREPFVVIDGQGGVEVNGSAAFTDVGVELAGEALASQAAPTVGLGGVELAGEALASQAAPTVGLGGVELASEALASQAAPTVGLGGVELAGEALAFHVTPTIGLGGVELAGEADANQGAVPPCPLVTTFLLEPSTIASVFCAVCESYNVLETLNWRTDTLRWETPSIAYCDGVGGNIFARAWVLFYDAGADTWILRSQSKDGATLAEWSLDGPSWLCEGDNDMALSFEDGTSCSGWPDPITVTGII